MKSAIRLIDSTSISGYRFLPLDQTLPDQGIVRAILKEKRPRAQQVNLSFLLPVIEQSNSCSSWHPAIFDSLNGAAMHSSILHVDGVRVYWQ